MTIAEVEEIKEKIQEKKDAGLKAEARMDDITSRLKEELDIDSIEAAEEYLEELDKDILSLQKKETKLENEITALVEQMEDDEDE